MSETTAKKKSDTFRNRAGLAKTVGAVALVLMVAGFLFTARQKSQEQELREQYSRTAARAAEHVRLRLEGYQSQVKTLGAPLRDFPAAKREHRVASEALSTEKKTFEEKEAHARKTAIERQTYADAQLRELRDEAKRSAQRPTPDGETKGGSATAFVNAHDAYAKKRLALRKSSPSPKSKKKGGAAPDAKDASTLKKEVQAAYRQTLKLLMAWEEEAKQGDPDDSALARLSAKVKKARRLEAERSEALVDLRSGVIAGTEAVESLQQAMRAEREAFSAVSEHYVLPSYSEGMKGCAEREHLNDDDAFLCLWREMAKLARVNLAFEMCPKKAFGIGETPRLLEGQVYIPVAGGVVCAAVPLENLFESEFITSPEPGSSATVGQVDQALLTDEQGNVLLSKIKSGNLQLRELVLNKDDGTEAPDQAHDPDSAARIARGALIGKVELAGRSFRAFLQPAVQLSAPLEGQTKKTEEDPKPQTESVEKALGLNVAVLVDAQRLRRESLRFSKTAFMWVVLIVGLTLLSLPLAKLWLLGPGSRYGRFDAGLMIFAGLLAALLTIVTGWASYSHFNLSARLNDELEIVGEKLELNLKNEIHSAANSLVKFRTESRSTREKLQGIREGLSQGTSYLRTGTLDSDTSLHELETSEDSESGEHSRANQSTDSGNAYACEYVLWDSYDGKTEPVCEKTGFENFKRHSGSPALTWLQGPHQFGWTSSAGNQLAKFTSGPNATVPVNLSSRHYFQRARNNDLDCLATKEVKGETVCSRRGAAEIVRSMTTGKYVLIVAAPEADPNEVKGSDPDEKKDGAKPKSDPAPETASSNVLSVTTHLRSLADLVLPRGYSAVVINREGRPLYHSNSATGYSIFEDLKDPDQLRATMNAGVKRELNDTYLGTSTRLSVRPFAATDWFLIVMAPTSGIDAMVSLMASITVVGVAAFLIVATLLMCLIMCIRLFLPKRPRGTAAHHREAIFRPQLSLQKDYARAGVFAVLASAVLCALALSIPEVSLVRVGLLLIASLAVVEAIIRRGRIVSALPLPIRRRVSVLFNRIQTSDWTESLLQFRERFRSGPAKESWRFSLASSYCLWLLGLVALWVGVPATALYAGAHEHVVTNAIRADQAHLLERLVERRQKLCLALGGEEGEPPWLVTKMPLHTSTKSENTGEGRWEKKCDASKVQRGLETKIHSATTEDNRQGSTDKPKESTASAGILLSDSLPLLSPLLDLLGPLPAPNREDGLRHHSSTWDRLDDGSLSLKAGPGLVFKSRIQELMSLTKLPRSSLWLLVGYGIAALFALGFGQLAVRRLFFVGILSKQERLGDVTIDALQQPLHRGRSLRLRATCVPRKLKDAKLHDFRFHTLEPGERVPRRDSKPLLIPELNDFTQSVEGQETLRDALSGGDPLLILTSFSLGEIEWLDSVLKSDLRLTVRHLHELDQEGGNSPVLSPPRYVIRTPSEEEQDTYKASGEFKVYAPGQSLPPHSRDKGHLILDLEDFLSTPEGLAYFKDAVGGSFPIVAFVQSRVGFDKLIENKDKRAVLLDFEKVRGKTSHDHRLSRHSTPSRAYMANLWEEASTDEKQVLAQMVHHGFVTPHPKWEKVVEHLASKAILDPDNLTMHPHFQAYIRARTDFDDAHPPEIRGQSTWDVLKAPLATAVAAVYAAFGISEPGMAFGGLLAPSVLAALPAVMRIVSGMGAHSSGSSD